MRSIFEFVINLKKFNSMVKKTDTQVEKKTRANGKNQKPIRKSEKDQAKKN